MAPSALPKSRSHAPVTNSESTARGRGFGSGKPQKMLTLRSLRKGQSTVATRLDRAIGEIPGFPALQSLVS
jgi:hypothetical protein